MKAGPRAQFLALPKHHVPQEQDWWGWGRGTAQVSPRAPVPTPCPLLTTTTMARIAFAVGLRDSVGWGGCSEGGVGYRPELITCQACLLGGKGNREVGVRGVQAGWGRGRQSLQTRERRATPEQSLAKEESGKKDLENKGHGGGLWHQTQLLTALADY